MSEHVTRSSFTSQNCRFFFFKLSLAQHSTHPFLQWMFIEHPLYTRCCLRHWVRSKAHIGCVLYELTVAAVTNCHELSGSKQPKFIILQLRSQKSKISFTGLDIKVSAELVPLGGSRKESIPLPFPSF